MAATPAAPAVTVEYQPPGALVDARKKQDQLYGPGAIAAGLAVYGFAEDVGWAKYVGAAALAFLGWKWYVQQQQIRHLQPVTVVDVLTQANKDALAQGLTGTAKQQFLYQRVAAAFGEDQAKAVVPSMAGASSRRRASVDTDEPPPSPGAGMNGMR